MDAVKIELFCKMKLFEARKLRIKYVFSFNLSQIDFSAFFFLFTGRNFSW
jgi:hypothetical protein